MDTSATPNRSALPPNGWIGFLSDYGLSDGFVGVCHGVVATIAPGTRVIDVCHDIPSGDLRRGAALLSQAAPYLPPGVLLGVIDPGVGTRRRALVVVAGHSYLVGPDNGMLLAAARALGGASAAYEITSPDVMRRPVSATFHGRDVFAPVAARLTTGMDPARVGAAVPVEDLVRLPEPVARLTAHRLEGEVLTVDRYGNVQTSLPASLLLDAGLREGATLTVHCRTGELRAPFGRTFGEVPPCELVGYIDSAGMFALALNAESASTEYDLYPGDPVALRLGA
jgi:S-adenosyl-L-methionine hydrolase (adenosine-forming)